MKYIQEQSLQVAKLSHDFIVQEAVPGTGIEPDRFWCAMEGIVREFGPRNTVLL